MGKNSGASERSQSQEQSLWGHYGGRNKPVIDVFLLKWEAPHEADRDGSGDEFPSREDAILKRQKGSKETASMGRGASRAAIRVEDDSRKLEWTSGLVGLLLATSTQ